MHEASQLSVFGLGPGPVRGQLYNLQAGGGKGVAGRVVGIGAAQPQHPGSAQMQGQLSHRGGVVLGLKPQQVAQVGNQD